jgi:hypothetical protein
MNIVKTDLIIAFESATSAAGASASAGHATNANWVGITLGLTVGVIGGLGIFIA